MSARAPTIARRRTDREPHRRQPHRADPARPPPRRCCSSCCRPSCCCWPVALRWAAGIDDRRRRRVPRRFALGTLVPLLGLIAGTGAIGPEIDDGSIVYLLAKPVLRRHIVRHQAARGDRRMIVFGALPTSSAGADPDRHRRGLAVGVRGRRRWSPASPTARCSCCSAVVTRHAVVVGLHLRADLGDPDRQLRARGAGR